MFKACIRISVLAIALGSFAVAAEETPTAPVVPIKPIGTHIGDVSGTVESVGTNSITIKVAQVVPTIVNKKVNVPNNTPQRGGNNKNKNNRNRNPYQNHVHPVNIKTVQGKVTYTNVPINLSAEVTTHIIGTKATDVGPAINTIKKGDIVLIHISRVGTKGDDGKWQYDIVGTKVELPANFKPATPPTPKKKK